EDRRPLFHRLPLVLERGGVLPLHARLAAAAERRHRGAVRDRGVRAGALSLSVAQPDHAVGDRGPRARVGGDRSLRARRSGRAPRPRGRLARLPGLLSRRLLRAERPARLTSELPPCRRRGKVPAMDLARLAGGVLVRPRSAPAPVTLAAEELAA